jgi:hypothetical protein
MQHWFVMSFISKHDWAVIQDNVQDKKNIQNNKPKIL